VESAIGRPARGSALTGLSDRRGVLLLAPLALGAALVDWNIAAVWHWSAGWQLVWLGPTMAVLGVGIGRPVWRTWAAALAAASLYGVPVLGAMARSQLIAGPTRLIGDGALQAQLATTLVLRGVDPYGADYEALGLGRTPWGEPFPNPALHHMVLWPGQFLIPLPLQAGVEHLLGWWDERVLFLLAAAAIALVIARLVPGPAGILAGAGFFVVPLHSLVAVLGDTDLPMVALLLGSLLAAHRRRLVLMVVLLGLAVATKQHGLVAAPFVLAWAGGRGVPPRRLALAGAGAAGTTLLVLLPFVLWDAGAFVADTILFVSAGGPDSYPINGYGLSTALLHAGVIHDPRDAFPFAPIEAAVAATLWLVGWRWLHRHRNVGDVLVFAGLSLLLVLYVSRYFHESHLVLGLDLMAAGFLARGSSA